MHDTFGTKSMAAAAGTVLLAQACHPMMLIPLRTGQTAAWLACLISAAASVLCYLPAARWLAAHRSGDLIDLAEAAAGRAGAIITALVMAGTLIYHSGLILRMTSEMTVTSSYPHTPQLFAMLGLLLCAFAGACLSLDALVHLCRLYLLPLALGTLGLLVGGLGWGEFRFLLPVFGPGVVPLLIKSVGTSAFFTPTILFLLMGAGGVRERRRLPLAGAAAVLLTALVLALAQVILVMTFPPPLGYHVTYPLHEMARLLVGGRFFERMEVIWLFLWVLTTAAHLSVTVHVAGRAYRRAFQMNDNRTVVVCLLVLVSVIALFPSDQADAITWRNVYFTVGAVASAGLPLLLTLLAALRGRGNSRAARGG